MKTKNEITVRPKASRPSSAALLIILVPTLLVAGVGCKYISVGTSKSQNAQSSNTDKEKNSNSSGFNVNTAEPSPTASPTPEGVFTPEKSSELRTAILDAVRVPVEKDLKQPIIFEVQTFNVFNDWAFVNGNPTNPKGGPLNLKGTKYEEAETEGFWDSNFQALLRNKDGKWTVVEYAIGCTDVCYATWWSDHKAPKKIFPYAE